MLASMGGLNPKGELARVKLSHSELMVHVPQDEYNQIFQIFIVNMLLREESQSPIIQVHVRL